MFLFTIQQPQSILFLFSSFPLYFFIELLFPYIPYCWWAEFISTGSMNISCIWIQERSLLLGRVSQNIIGGGRKRFWMCERRASGQSWSSEQHGGSGMRWRKCSGYSGPCECRWSSLASRIYTQSLHQVEVLAAGLKQLLKVLCQVEIH